MANSDPRGAGGPARWYWCWLGLFLLAACARPDGEQRLRAQVERMQTAAAERRPGDFMAGVSDDFIGNGGTDRAAMHNLMKLQVLGRSSVGVINSPLEVEMRDATATVRFSVLVSGGSARLLRDSAQAYSITSGWREEGGDWKVYSADWKPKL